MTRLGSLEIDYDFPSDIYTIGGVRVAAEVLRALIGNFPDDRSYRFVRQDDIVKVRVSYDDDEQKSDERLQR
jgi:hypothetical protein